MDTATDVLPGNALPWEVSNLIVIVFIILLVLWAVRLCRVGLHLQDLRAGVNSDQVRQESHTQTRHTNTLTSLPFVVTGVQILQVDGLGPFMPIVSVLEKQHLTQFLRTHRAAPAQTVPQLQQPFEVERVDIANSVDTAGLQLPAGVKVSLTAEVTKTPPAAPPLLTTNVPRLPLPNEHTGSLLRAGLLGCTRPLCGGIRARRRLPAS